MYICCYVVHVHVVHVGPIFDVHLADHALQHPYFFCINVFNG